MATATDNRRRVPRAEREEQMVEAATALFAAHGFASVAMDAIAAACGITKPMLYSYFGSKDGLFLACVERASAELRAEVRAAGLGAPAPDVGLYRGYVAVMRFAQENEELWSLLYPHGPDERGTFAAAGARAHDDMAALLAELIGALAALRGSGDAVEPEPLAHMITGATIAIGSWSRR
jgi:AcrR family transcriptional regulator